MLTLEKIKLYLRLDTDFEDELITDLTIVAESYMTDAVTDYQKHYAADEKFAAKADHCKMAIISELFGNRDPRNDNRNSFSYAIQSMVNQLNYFEPEEVKDDEDSRQSDNTDND